MINKSTALLASVFVVGMPLHADEVADRPEGSSYACPVSSSWSSTASAQHQADREAIEELMRVWSEAVAASDLETIASLVTVDCEFWTHDAAPLVGREALASAFGEFLQTYAMKQAFDCQELVISGDLAFMRGMEVNRLTAVDGGEVVVRRQRAFSVLKRSPSGAWRFARGMTNRPPGPLGSETPDG